MIARSLPRVVAVAACLLLSTSGCAYHGLNSVPLPGAVGRGSGASSYHVQLVNVGTLESNSPVLVDDVVVGSVGPMSFKDWHAEVEVSVREDVVVPANAVAAVGQTSLLGSMHLSLDPPIGVAPEGRLKPGATLLLDRSLTYPSTEQTLLALSAVVNGGGLGQIGDILHNLSAAMTGNQEQIRSLLTRLDTFIGTLNSQRDNIIASIQALDRLADKFAGQREVVAQALRKIPPALDVMVRESSRFTTALDKLRTFSDTTTQLVNDTHADLVTNLRNLEPTLRALADVGPGLDEALSYFSVFPYGQDVIDRGLRGDYMNLFGILDLTVPRLKRGLFLGTRWGQEGAALVPAPGEPGQIAHTYDPLMAPLESEALPPGLPAPDAPPPPITGPILPVVPPPTVAGESAITAGSQIFAGPYGTHPVTDTPKAGG